MAEDKGILKYLGLTSIIENAKALVDTRVKLVKLEIKDELAKALSNVLISILLLNFLFFALLLLSIGISIYFGDLWGSYFYGFAAVAGFYGCLFVLLLLLKDKIGLREIIEKELNKVLNIDN